MTFSEEWGVSVNIFFDTESGFKVLPSPVLMKFNYKMDFTIYATLMKIYLCWVLVHNIFLGHLIVDQLKSKVMFNKNSYEEDMTSECKKSKRR